MRAFLAPALLLFFAQPAVDVAGEWALTITDPLQRTYAVQLRLDQDGGRLTGTAVDSAAGTAEDVAGTVDGERVTMSYQTDAPGAGRIRLAFEGRIDGDGMAGSVAFGRLASGAWRAERED